MLSSMRYRTSIWAQSVSAAQARLGVHGRDRRLQLVRPDRPGRQRLLRSGRTPSSMLTAIPQRPVLLGQRHQRTVGAARAARRESVSSINASSPVTSPAAWQVPMQPPGQTDRLVRQRRVGQSRRQWLLVWPSVKTRYSTWATADDPVRHLLGRRNAEPRSDLAQPRLGSADPLRHRGFGHQESPGYLRGAQPGDGTQRQRDLRWTRQRRVAAQQQQRQRVIPFAD